MRPRLTGRGLQVLLVGGLYALLGVVLERPYLVTLGGAAISLLLVERVRAAASAARLAAGDLRLGWQIAWPDGRRSIETGRPFSLKLRLAHSGAPLGTARVSAYASSELKVEDAAPVPLTPGVVETDLTVRARAAGTWWLHGALLTLSGPLGLFSTHAFFPTPLRVRALPALPPRRGRPQAPGGSGGQQRRRNEGPGSDLQEIREAVPGDPYRHVAWKATARTGRLMVRRFRNESPIDQTLCLDLAMEVSRGPSASPLDEAIGSLASHARAALVAGDRVGLVTFDDRVRAHVMPADGLRQLRRLLDILLEARSQPDDSTLSDAEVIATVAYYLSWQEGIVLRVPPPPLESARWDDLWAGPTGDLYEAGEMDRRVCTILARESPEALRAAKHKIDRARLLIRARGIETPRRTAPSQDSRLRGLEEAVRLADREVRCHISLWTDLDPAQFSKIPWVRRARQRHGLALGLRARKAA